MPPRFLGRMPHGPRMMGQPMFRGPYMHRFPIFGFLFFPGLFFFFYIAGSSPSLFVPIMIGVAFLAIVTTASRRRTPLPPTQNRAPYARYEDMEYSTPTSPNPYQHYASSEPEERKVPLPVSLQPEEGNQSTSDLPHYCPRCGNQLDLSISSSGHLPTLYCSYCGSKLV